MTHEHTEPSQVPHGSCYVHVNAAETLPPAQSAWSLRIENTRLDFTPDSPWAGTSLHQSASWDALTAELAVSGVTDHRAIGFEFLDAWLHLFPILQPGGQYCVNADVPADIADPVDWLIEAIRLHLDVRGPATVAACVRYVSSAVSSITHSAGRMVVTKSPQAEYRVTSKDLDELELDVHRTVAPDEYERVVPHLHAPAYMLTRILDHTANLSPQRVQGAGYVFLDDVTVYGYGQLLLEDRWVIEESFAHFDTQARGFFFRVPDTQLHLTSDDILTPVQVHQDHHFIIVKQNWDWNYGHWIIDNFARLSSLSDVVDLARSQFVIPNTHLESMREVMLDSLALLGVRSEQIVIAHSLPIKIQHGIYPTPMTKAPFVKHPEAVAFLTGLVPRARALGGRNHAPAGRIYLSRAKFGSRRLLNESDLLPTLEADGYCVLFPEELSLFDQMATFAEATHVIGVMGAAFSNVVFAPRGVKQLCLGTQTMGHDYFYDIACLKQGVYVGLQGSADDDTPGAGSDFNVDPAVFFDMYVSHGFAD